MSDIGPQAESAAPRIAGAMSYAAMIGAGLYIAAAVVNGDGPKIRDALKVDALPAAEFVIAVGGLYWIVTSPGVPAVFKTITWIGVVAFLATTAATGRLVSITEGYARGDGLLVSIVKGLGR